MHQTQFENSRVMEHWEIKLQLFHSEWAPPTAFSISVDGSSILLVVQDKILYSSLTLPLSLISAQFNSVAQSCPTPCDPTDCSTPGLPVHHQLLELAQTHVHQVGDVIQPSHPLSFPSPPAFNLFQHQGLFQGVSSSHQVAKILELQPQHQSLQ